MRKPFNSITLILLGVAQILGFGYCDLDYVQVDIDVGTLRGFNTTSWRGSAYFAFQGIPYAEPPIDELRFKGPQEKSSWDGVRDAIDYGSICPQLSSAEVVGDEDCLFLNVYTPSLNDEQLPVMVFIHGGAFVTGSGNEYYGPGYFMEAGVVLVTLNYRLGALGFLSTEDDDAPGNAGLKDQVAALKWVQRNIANFGGNSTNVTLFGWSAGGTSVHFHLLSPMSSGLFARAITQSGSALGPRWRSANMAEHTIRLAEALGAEDLANDTVTALEFLRATSYEDIVNIQDNLQTDEEARMLVAVFGPSVEKDVTSEEVFLPDLPLNIIKSGNSSNVPYMLGYNDQEAYMYYDEVMQPDTMTEAFEDTDRYVPIEITDEQSRYEISESIREFYFDNKPVGYENISNLFDLITDTRFLSTIQRSARLHLWYTDSSVYFYRFSYDGESNMLKLLSNLTFEGATHGDEIGYLFEVDALGTEPEVGSEDETVQYMLTRLWTNFAKYGDPTPAGDPLTWEPVTVDQFNYLNIVGADTNLAVDPDTKRKDFWAKVYEGDEVAQSANSASALRDDFGKQILKAVTYVWHFFFWQ